MINLIIRRPTLVAVLFIILVMFGLFSYGSLKQELMPRIDFPFLYVTATYPGAGAYEVESSVAKKLEDALAGLEGLKNIDTYSMEGYAVLLMEFELSVNVDYVLQQTTQRIGAIRGDLPAAMKEPSVNKFGPGDEPVITLSVSTNLPPVKSYDLIKNSVKPMMENVEGVGAVNMSGGSEREIQVDLDKNKLYAYNLSIAEVTEAIRGANLEFPAGAVKNERERQGIRLSGKFKTPQEIAETIVAPRLKIKDIGTVTDGVKEAETLIRINGTDSLGLVIFKKDDANAVSVSDGVMFLMEKLKNQYKDINFSYTVAADTADFTEAANKSVQLDLLLSVTLVCVTMFLFLHSVRNMFIVAISIPVSLISTFTFMYLAGFTLNLFSLVALSLVVGILVDDAIVVVENIHRHLEMGKKRLDAVLDGMREIMGTVFSITLVIVVVFVPICATNSIVTNIFRQFAMTVAVATLFSLLASFTIVPALASRIAKLEFSGGIAARFTQNLVEGLSASITGALRWTLNHKPLVGFLTTALFAGSFLLVAGGFIGTEFADVGDRGEFYINMELEKSAPLEKTYKYALLAEKVMRESPYVTDVFTTVGQNDIGKYQPYKAGLLVRIVSKKERDFSEREAARLFKIELQEKVAGPKFTTSPSAIFGGEDDAPISFYVKGDDTGKLLKVSAEIADEMRKIAGIVDPKISVEAGNPEVSITLNRDKMAELSVPLALLGESVSNAYAGNTDAKYAEGQFEYDINVRFAEKFRRSAGELALMPVKNLKGEQVLLSQFANVEEKVGPTRLERRNRQSSVSVSAQLLGRDLGSVGTDLKALVQKMGYDDMVEYSGDLSIQEDSFGSLLGALVISIALVYLILVALYNSFSIPFVVISAIPLSAVGSLLALALTRNTLSIFSMMGVIMLTGLVIKNSVILVDFANKRRLEGQSIRDALLESVQLRFRPIFMTTIAMVMGMLPIALASGAASEWKNGIGWVLIGGLISSMFLTMFVVPMLYELLGRMMKLERKEGGYRQASD